MTTRTIREIAADIESAWHRPYFGAVPYMRAMWQLETINDKYGMDPARDIILYFLSNAATFRGEKARQIKQELKKIAGIK